MALAAEPGFTTTWSDAPGVEGFENPVGPLSNPGKGGNPGGFLEATRSGGVNVQLRPIPYSQDDWGALFGTAPGTISFDVKALDDYTIPEIRFWLSDGGSSFRYIITTRHVLKHPQTRADGWVHYTIPWQATWDNARAKDKGWVGNTKNAKWANVIKNPRYSHMDILGAGKGKDDQSVGIDNFRVEAGKPLDAATLARLRKGAEPLPPQKDPVAHYTFEEGSGDVLKDHSGHKNHGRIHGAKWVRNGTRWALEFDGVDDYVDCGDSRSLNPRRALTMETWVYATDRLSNPDVEVPILGKGFNYAITKLRDGTWAYIMGGQIGHRVNAFLPFDKWVHLAQVYDGTFMHFLIDGRLVGSAKPRAWIPPGLNFCLASATGKARFRGRIASVKLYNRALTHDEILADIRSTNITGNVIPSPVPVGAFGEIWVEVDAARLGRPLDNLSVDVAVHPTEGANARPRVTKSVKGFDKLGRALVKLDARALGPGECVVQAIARDAAGKTVGIPGSAHVAWPGGIRFPKGPDGARQLNNFVTELLRVAGPDDSATRRTFLNPRTGWVYISNRGSKEVRLTGDAIPAAMDLPLSKDYGDAYETMHFLPEGKYTIITPLARDLAVRAIGQSIHATANIEPVVQEFGPYSGAFEARYIFPHVNTLEILPYDADKPFVKEWRAKGRMILPHLSYRIRPKEGQSKVDAAYEMLINQPGFAHPLCDGNACDEFGWANETTAIWGKALKKALSEPRFKGKAFYPYSYRPFTHFDSEDGRDLVEAVKQCGGAYLWEAYVKDQRTELNAWRFLNQAFAEQALFYAKKYPGLLENMIVCCYVMLSAPNESTMTLSCVNLKVVMEMQFNMAANHPAFQGLRGMLTYRSNYAEKETLRWAGRLFRHYCIEGHTEMLSKNPYILTHLANPAFEHQGVGWDLKPAQENGIRFDVIPGLSWMAMGYPPTAEGDTTLITTRSKKGPNVFSQKVEDLEPGRLYCLRMVSVDAQDFSRRKSRKMKHAVSIKLEGATPVPDESLTVVYPSCYSHRLGAYTGRANPLWLNYYVRVFRAEGKTATLAISDWADDKTPGGAIGQQLGYTFIRVQPYWAE